MDGKKKNWLRNLFSHISSSRVGQFLCITGAYFTVELLSFVLLTPSTLFPLIFGLLWSALQASIVLLLPKKASRILFGITFYIGLAWALTQAGYYHVFGKMMWLSTLLYAGEGAMFIGDVLLSFPVLWWILGIAAAAFGGILIRHFSTLIPQSLPRLANIICSVCCIAGLFLVPLAVFAADDFQTDSGDPSGETDYAQTYETMCNAKAAYDICGVYQLTFRDFWVNNIYPLTEDYRQQLQDSEEQVDAYFNKRETGEKNQMTGIFEGKNVVYVIMESMDDWMITEQYTPTIYRLMNEGIRFTRFYTPGYGGARTLNSEFCLNTGIYLPSSGSYVFDYLENDFHQSIAHQMDANGYTCEVFHYNSPDFYSRGELEPALGYDGYNSFESYVSADQLLDECLLFTIPETEALFFREGPTFNTYITRSAHLSYFYYESLSQHALSLHPEYKGMFSSEEEDCARVKAKLVDDFFALLIQKLEQHGQLENTVIVAVSDHYAYGYQDDSELIRLSGIGEDQLLLLEETPCFIWSAEGPCMTVSKTLNTADLLPTVLNLMGITPDIPYLGRDAFDPNYSGYAIFPDGSWISDGVACSVTPDMEYQVIQNEKDKPLSRQYLTEMAQLAKNFIEISNLLLITDYYAK